MAVLRLLDLGFLVFAVLGPVGAGAQQTRAVAAPEPRPSFEVASIKPSKPDDQDHKSMTASDRVTIENYTLRDLIAFAYGLKHDSQVVGGPGWLDKTYFDIAAVVGEAETAKLRSLPMNERTKEWNAILQSLLADRFGLKVRRDKRSVQIYALVVAKSGSKLTPAAASDKGHGLTVNNQRMTATAISMDSLADSLTQMRESDDRVVVNQTNLTGEYDFRMDWTPDVGAGVPSDTHSADLLTALHEQLGLELKSEKGDVPVVVVEAANGPEFD